MPLTGNVAFEHELKKRVHEERERIKEILALGQGVPDYQTYLKYVGQCQALTNVATDYCAEVNETLDKR